MSNRKHLCFNCLLAFRREANSTSAVKCSACGGDCINIGYKIPVPPKSKPKEWDDLRNQLTNEHLARTLANQRRKVQNIHSLEKEIGKLEALPENSGRASLIKKLKQRLDQVNA